MTGHSTRGRAMPNIQSRFFAYVLLATAVVLILIPDGASAFYEKGSDVVPLTKSSWKKNLLKQGSGDYLWVVEFYREGCGYCQLFTPEYEKAAGNLKNLVKVGAVDTERENALAGDHGKAEEVQVEHISSTPR